MDLSFILQHDVVPFLHSSTTSPPCYKHRCS